MRNQVLVRNQAPMRRIALNAENKTETSLSTSGKTSGKVRLLLRFQRAKLINVETVSHR